MKKLFILVNKLSQFTFFDYIDEYLNDISVSIGEHLPQHTENYDLILLWNFRKIIPELGNKSNVVVFHSSNLPQGKGWAPIYYTIANGEEYYTITGILPNERVDAGDILVKARFKMQDNYTANQLRDWDNRIMLMLTGQLLRKCLTSNLCGIPQKGRDSFYIRRQPEDSEVKLDVPLGFLVNHLRACEDSYPAYFWLNKTKYYIYVRPEIQAEFPADLEIKFFGNLALDTDN